MFNKQADLFFEEPSQYRPPPGVFGVLYLLRRDATQCTGVDPNTGAKNMAPILWPGAMCILAGVDLLAKFWRGSDQIGQVSTRFKDFVDQYFKPLSSGDNEVIYQLRNSLLHSFGLYSEGKGKVYRFVLSTQHAPLIQFTVPETYQIDLLTLHEQFETAIVQYKIELESDTVLKNNFNLMFSRYGSIQYG
jgi:hypothetical protein